MAEATEKKYGSAQIQFRAGEMQGDIEARTDGSTSLSITAQRDLGRYYAMIRQTLARWSFSEGEASLIVDALNGTIMEPHTAHLLWAEIEDAIKLDALDEKWDVDGESLIFNLKQASPFETLAIVDAAERFWNGPYRNQEPMIEKLHAVGLVR